MGQMSEKFDGILVAHIKNKIKIFNSNKMLVIAEHAYVCVYIMCISGL